MASSTFHPFSRLPREIRDTIWRHSVPSTTTVHIREGADLDVTLVSPPPGEALASKEAREIYITKAYKPYSIYTVDDWAEIHVNKDSTIQVVVTPSENPKANLNITWTELQVVLHEALPVVKRLHVVCSKPERLVRLWMLPEGGLVAPGKSHWDEDLFGKENVASDREYRESLRRDIQVTSSVATLEELEQGSREMVQVRELVEERVVEGFGREAKFSTTKAFKLVGEEQDREVEEWEDMVLGGEVSDGVLTEKAMENLTQETGWVPKNSTPSSEYSVPVFYDGELWLTVS